LSRLYYLQPVLKMKNLFLILNLFLAYLLTNAQNSNLLMDTIVSPSLIVLGTLQDAGAPHIACKKDCCKTLFKQPDINLQVVSLGIIDPINEKSYLFEATPDIVTQMKTLSTLSTFSNKETPDGIFLTHAHIGHYAGLMYLGKEAMDAQKMPIFAMPKMKTFLENNGPWNQLVSEENISIQSLKNETVVKLTSQFSVIPFTVPHRDEYSETVGYKIKGPNKSVLFIPDIDKWHLWNKDIVDEIQQIDYAFIDATFFDSVEVNNRDISEIPHPFIIESMELFKDLPAIEKQKVHFIHFNHTNPAINLNSEKARLILKNGFNIAKINSIFEL